MSKSAQMENHPASPLERPAERTATADEPVGQIPYDRQWLGSILRPALIAVMIGCLDLALLSLIVRFNPALASGYAQMVVLLSTFAALFACAITAWLAQPGRRSSRRPIYRLAEFCFLLLLTRLLSWLTMANAPTITELLYRPLASLLDGPFVFAAIVVSLSWLLASMFTDDLLRLALQPDELFAIENDRIGELIRTSNSDRPAILQRIVARWVGGGIVLVLIAASVRLERPDSGFFAITRQNIDPTIIAAVVIYFLAGLLLISQGQLAILRTRWLIDRIPASEQVLGQWPIYVFALLLLVGFVAALLPFGGTFLLAQILYTIITFISNTIFAIFRFFMGLLLLIIAMFAGEAPAAETPPPPPPEQPLLPDDIVPPGTPMPEWAGGAFFWLVMALFLGYAAYVYLSDKGVQFTWLTAFWQLLRARWQALFGAYQQWQRTRLRKVKTVDAEAEEESNRKRFGWRQRSQQLDPTQRVRQLYLAMVERAKERGIGRHAGETPLQYAPRLGAAIHRAASQAANESKPNESEPDEREPDERSEQQAYAADVQTLTDAFVRTRYANEQVSESEASLVEQLWEKINRRLQAPK